MKVEFKKSLLKDIKKIKNKPLQNSIYNCIIHVETAQFISEIKT